MQFAGLLWGVAAPKTPYPPIAISAHVLFMTSAAMVLLTGFLLKQPLVIELGAIESRIVYWGFAGLWVILASECLNSFWGANQIMVMVSSVAIYVQAVWSITLTPGFRIGCSGGRRKECSAMARARSEYSAYCSLDRAHYRICGPVKKAIRTEHRD